MSSWDVHLFSRPVAVSAVFTLISRTPGRYGTQGNGLWNLAANVERVPGVALLYVNKAAAWAVEATCAGCPAFYQMTKPSDSSATARDYCLSWQGC